MNNSVNLDQSVKYGIQVKDHFVQQLLSESMDTRTPDRLLNMDHCTLEWSIITAATNRSGVVRRRDRSVAAADCTAEDTRTDRQAGWMAVLVGVNGLADARRPGVRRRSTPARAVVRRRCVTDGP